MLQFRFKWQVSSVCQGDVNRVWVKLAPVIPFATNNQPFFRVVTFWPPGLIGFRMTFWAKQLDIFRLFATQCTIVHVVQCQGNTFLPAMFTPMAPLLNNRIF